MGAGPAGMAASITLAKNGIEHFIVDKCTFPRDKICGDALSGKVIHEFRKYFPESLQGFKNLEKKMGSMGVIFTSPGGQYTEIPFRKDIKPEDDAPGFVVSRYVFDHFLYAHLDPKFASFIQADIGDVQYTDKGITILDRQNQSILDASVVIAADGANSLIRRRFMPDEQTVTCAGLRQYWSNVKGLHPKGYIELHFLKDIQPGYFWIFPMAENRANVGIGMLTDKIKSSNLNLRTLFENVLQKHPVISERFKDAMPLESAKGWPLTLGTKKRSISGNCFLLAGDAASLIDPFTGEGIANAITSGRIAAETVIKATHSGNFSAENLKLYDDQIYQKIGGELAISNQLMKVSQYKSLFNFIVNRAEKNQFLKSTLIDMFNQSDLRKQLYNPIFYLRLILGR